MSANASKPGWIDVVTRKRRDQRTAIESFMTANLNSTPCDDEIRHLEYSALVERLSSGSLSAEAVTIAYIRGAISAHEKTNCLTEVFFSDALKRAKDLDACFHKEGRPVGRLHGIPISLKDQFNVQGYDTTLGYVGRAYSPAGQDASLVQILVQQGAVLIAKTNVPQSIMMAETNNPLWGLTVNPRDDLFTPGGSSGGESALLASQGSLIGWGTDIGGSIRGPSHMMGLFGLKPSHGRLPYYNVAVSTEGQEHVPSVVGPLTRSLGALIDVTSIVIDSEPWKLDPKCINMPWNAKAFNDVLSRPLTIGVIWDDGVVKVHPPIARALREFVEKAKNSGHEVIDWDPVGHDTCIKIQDQYYTADGGEDIRREVNHGGEPLLPYVQALVDRAPAISVYEYWQLHRQKLECQRAYLEKWNNTRAPGSGRKVDVLLGPVMPHSAVPHNCCRWVGYTKVWNFLDYPAVSFPVTQVSKDIDVLDSTYVPRNAFDEWNWKLYDPGRMDKHPIGLQLIAQRHEEEKVLAATQVLLEAYHR